MKNKIIIFLLLLLVPLGVNADSIYSIDMDINIDEYGTASITETWVVKADSGSEWYKSMYNLGNSEISDFTVEMDGVPLTYKDWDVDEGMSEKRGYYGINNTSSGPELCFGKYDYEDHTFILNYQVSNFIFNAEDSQILYWTLMPEISLDKITVEVSSHYYFNDVSSIWGFGYKGQVELDNGKIKMYSTEGLSNEYVVLLARFPLNTFNTSNSYSKYETFDSVYDLAVKGSYKHDYKTLKEKIIDALTTIFMFLFVGFFVFIGIKMKYQKGFGYINNKKIIKKEVPMFREIPCNKDIYYANALIKINNFSYIRTNIMGAIILKWVKQDKIKFKTTKTGIFNKESSTIELFNNLEFDNSFEKRLYNIMFDASRDGILETRELERWCQFHQDKFLNLFDEMVDDKISDLRNNKKINLRKNKSECKYQNVMDDTIYQDSKELYGLKLFLEEFSSIDKKEVLEVKLWDEYLMFAYLFGIADKVAKQLKNLYPEVMEQASIDYGAILFISNIASRSNNAASSSSVSSSGGGGGGSFGGGGSAGGR